MSEQERVYQVFVFEHVTLFNNIIISYLQVNAELLFTSHDTLAYIHI